MKNFFLRSTWTHADRLMALITCLFLAWAAAPALYPVSMFYVVDDVTVEDAVAGEDPTVRLTSLIKRTTNLARYEVTIRAFPSQSVVCVARDNPPYKAGTALTPDMSNDLLAWWAYSKDGHCVDQDLEQGRYVVSTRHCWRPYWWLRERCDDTSQSNVFTVFADQDALEGHDQQLIAQIPTRSLARQVEQIQSQVVGRTPEGFHRTDAQELLDALCAANPALRCPNAYRLPNYLRQTEASE